MSEFFVSVFELIFHNRLDKWKWSEAAHPPTEPSYFLYYLKTQGESEEARRLVNIIYAATYDMIQQGLEARFINALADGDLPTAFGILDQVLRQVPQGDPETGLMTVWQIAQIMIQGRPNNEVFAGPFGYPMAILQNPERSPAQICDQ